MSIHDIDAMQAENAFYKETGQWPPSKMNGLCQSFEERMRREREFAKFMQGWNAAKEYYRSKVHG
jgi:hypothetical protein